MLKTKNKTPHFCLLSLFPSCPLPLGLQCSPAISHSGQWVILAAAGILQGAEQQAWLSVMPHLSQPLRGLWRKGPAGRSSGCCLPLSSTSHWPEAVVCAEREGGHQLQFVIDCSLPSNVSKARNIFFLSSSTVWWRHVPCLFRSGNSELNSVICYRHNLNCVTSMH